MLHQVLPSRSQPETHNYSTPAEGASASRQRRFRCPVRRHPQAIVLSLAVAVQRTLSATMKVLLFVRDLAVGGSQRQLAVLAAGLARRGHDVAVAVLYAGGALEKLLGESGARLLSIGKSRRWDVVGPLAKLRR